MKNSNPWEEFNKYKVTNMKNHKLRHTKYIHGHYCPSWWGQYICEYCREYFGCECLNKVIVRKGTNGIFKDT